MYVKFGAKETLHFCQRIEPLFRNALRFLSHIIPYHELPSQSQFYTLHNKKCNEVNNPKHPLTIK